MPRWTPDLTPDEFAKFDAHLTEALTHLGAAMRMQPGGTIGARYLDKLIKVDTLLHNLRFDCRGRFAARTLVDTVLDERFGPMNPTP